MNGNRDCIYCEDSIVLDFVNTKRKNKVKHFYSFLDSNGNTHDFVQHYVHRSVVWMIHEWRVLYSPIFDIWIIDLQTKRIHFQR